MGRKAASTAMYPVAYPMTYPVAYPYPVPLYLGGNKSEETSGPKYSSQGASGSQGPSGPPGPQGRDGRDGRDGKDGRDGRDGRDCKDGNGVAGTFDASSQFQQIERDVKEDGQRIVALQRKLEDLERQIPTGPSVIASDTDTPASIATIAANLAEARRTIDAMQVNINDMRGIGSTAEIERIKKEFEEARNALKDFVAGVEKTMLTLQTQLESNFLRFQSDVERQLHAAERDTLNKFHKIETDIDKDDRDITALREKLDGMEKEAAKHNGDFNGAAKGLELDGRLRTLEGKMGNDSAYSAKFQKIESDMTEDVRHILALQERLTELEHQMATDDSSSAAVEAVEAVAADLAAARETITAMQANIEGLWGDSNADIGRIEEQVKEEREALQRFIARVEGTIQELQTHKADFEQFKSDVGDGLRAINAELFNMKDGRDTTGDTEFKKTVLEQVNAELDAFTARMQPLDTTTASSAEMDELRDQLAGIMTRLNTLTSTMATTTALGANQHETLTKVQKMLDEFNANHFIPLQDQLHQAQKAAILSPEDKVALQTLADKVKDLEAAVIAGVDLTEFNNLIGDLRTDVTRIDTQLRQAPGNIQKNIQGDIFLRVHAMLEEFKRQEKEEAARLNPDNVLLQDLAANVKELEAEIEGIRSRAMLSLSLHECNLGADIHFNKKFFDSISNDLPRSDRREFEVQRRTCRENGESMRQVIGHIVDRLKQRYRPTTREEYMKYDDIVTIGEHRNSLSDDTISILKAYWEDTDRPGDGTYYPCLFSQFLNNFDEGLHLQYIDEEE